MRAYLSRRGLLWFFGDLYSRWLYRSCFGRVRQSPKRRALAKILATTCFYSVKSEGGFRSFQGCGPIEARHDASRKGSAVARFHSSQGCGPIEAAPSKTTALRALWVSAAPKAAAPLTRPDIACLDDSSLVSANGYTFLDRRVSGVSTLRQLSRHRVQMMTDDDRLTPL
jgi:hypothetical protein